MFLLFLATAASAQNVIVLPNLYAVAEKIAATTVDFKSAVFDVTSFSNSRHNLQ